MLRATALLPHRLPLSSSSRSKIYLNKMSSTTSAEPEPLCRKFVPFEQSGITSISKPEGVKFRLVSYNILAQVYVKSALFPHSPAPCLKWKARSQAILMLLQSLEADFFCLQEIDEYDNFYKVNLESYGYSSVYIKRSGQKRDGCGIFYKPNKAELVIEEKIEYNDLVNLLHGEAKLYLDKDKHASASGNSAATSKDGLELTSAQGDRGDPNDPRVRLKRDCVGIMAAFKLKDSSHRIIIVANTHLYWDPEWADVKLAQAKYLLSRLAQFKMLVSDKFQCMPSVILAGDFNSVPGDKVYQYLTSGSSSLELVQELPEDLPIPLCSVYAYTREEPEFTNCTPDFTNTLDYIFFTPSGDLKPVSYLELPERKSSDVHDGLPNYHHPSDHLPIGAEFEAV